MIAVPLWGGVIVAYALGSIPSAYIAGRLLKGVDLRRHGSGNLGATNVLRTLGAPAALAVLLADAAKGAAAVLWVPRLVDGTGSPLWPMLFGLAAIAGHVRPVFLLWQGGGKGVATAAGVFGALAPVPLLIAVAVFLLVLATTRLMSLGSLSAAAALPLAVAIVRGPRDPLVLIGLAVTVFVFWTHRANIGRLRRGVEPRLGDKTLAQ